MDALPLEVVDHYWLYEDRHYGQRGKDVGKWMLFYPKEKMNSAWMCAKQMYIDKKLDGIFAMKCSTNKPNDRSTSTDDGVIILYMFDSYNEDAVLSSGKNVIKMLNYTENQYIYYKTDIQTYYGTMATGSNINHAYKLFNPLYVNKFHVGKCLID